MAAVLGRESNRHQPPPVLPRWGGNGLLTADRSKNQLDTKSSL